MEQCMDMLNGELVDLTRSSEAERYEMVQLGIVTEVGEPQPAPVHPPEHPPIPKKSVRAPGVLNEAYDYDKPSSFSRALSFEIGGHKMLLISGTASVDERGETIHVGDFRAQLWRTFRNITELLEAEDPGEDLVAAAIAAALLEDEHRRVRAPRLGASESRQRSSWQRAGRPWSGS